MKYMTHSIASTTWVALKRSRMFYLPDSPLCGSDLPNGSGLVVLVNRMRVSNCSARYHLERRCVRLVALLKKRHRRRHATGAMRYAGEGQSHLDAGQRAFFCNVMAPTE